MTLPLCKLMLPDAYIGSGIVTGCVRTAYLVLHCLPIHSAPSYTKRTLSTIAAHRSAAGAWK